MIGRRRFITITAGAGLSALVGGSATAAAAPLSRWKGVAMGASATIAVTHPQAPRLLTRARAEIERLEQIFSLYRPDSALTRLNADGRLAAPPFELVDLLSVCETLHARTNGAFDPAVQPLWALYARRYAAGTAPSDDDIADALRVSGWRHVAFSPAEVTLATNGAALTLNGIAQGYVSDRVADLLRDEGVSDVLVDIGEIVALGRHPDGRPWRAGIADPSNPDRLRSSRLLSDMAMATSAPLGTVFDREGAIGHIIDPRTGRPGGKWRQVSVITPSATLADGLSTAFCLMDREQIAQAAFDVEVDLVR